MNVRSCSIGPLDFATAERSAAFAKRADATRSFYAALKPEQQKTFDAETLRFGPGGERHHGPRGHGHPPAPAKS